MTLKLSPEILRAGYEFLRATAPFKSWKLPHAEYVEFRVTDAVGEHGDYMLTKSGQDIISLSQETLGHTINVIAVLAHELVHMKMAHDGTIDEDDLHGERFQKLAKLVCRHHGFDPKVFI